MDFKDKPIRDTLKGYFKRNAIPTESNFAALIESAINQKEDGIAKLPDQPLCLQPDVNDTGLEKVINFYKKLTDKNPEWTLSLNPNAAPGWSIGDADGNSKLFIDKNTGNVGIGMTDPKALLHVEGNAVINGSETFPTLEVRGDAKVSGDLQARNAKPLRQQLVHKRPLYGIGAQPAFLYDSSAFKRLIFVYHPFGYAVPRVQEGAKRKFRLYAIYSDTMKGAGSHSEVLFRPWANNRDPRSVTFNFPRTWGDASTYRDAYSQEWIEGTPMGGHAEILLKTTDSHARLTYLEMETWDFFE